ncbi:MAG: type II secretion system minor pseudopilin GspK [Nitrospirota bacterium]|nr:type II secretion system minor pseudopilin GspK [Nitrospirota bacterium]MDH5768034.1 type II secretion system minor pseudopilin GspK [Nitrospirota bacterium]
MLTLITHYSPVSLRKAGQASLITNNKGMALVLTLLVLALITALVVEFSYAVYTNTNALYNWKTSQRLSFVAKSGVQLASKTILEEVMQHPSYTYPGSLNIPIESPFEDFKGTVLLRIEDENSKFNINSIVYSNGALNDEAYHSFVRLLRALGIESGIADRIVDWIDPDKEPRLSDSEKASKNLYLDSIDELLLIPGIDNTIYEKIATYVTIYGDGLININGAEIPVLMSLSDSINKNMAERIVAYRKISPFQSGAYIQSVAGITYTIYNDFGVRITAKGTHFRIISTVTEEGIKKVIESVLVISGTSTTVKYWREM